MEKNQTVQMVKLVTPGQMKDIISAVAQAIPTNMSFDTAKYWIGKKGKLGNKVKNIFMSENPYSDLILAQEKFYRDLGIDCDLSDVRIPDDPGGFGRVIIMAKGITPQSAYDFCAKFFTCWKWTDKSLDEVIDFSFQTRSTKNGSYAIRIRDRVEADEELKNLSANQIAAQSIPSITLEERLIYELQYFKGTGKHLDINNITLSAGSRDSDGFVPRVYWYDGKLKVYYFHPDVADGRLRSRQVVS
jgi:hypothetical protein